MCKILADYKNFKPKPKPAKMQYVQGKKCKISSSNFWTAEIVSRFKKREKAPMTKQEQQELYDHVRNIGDIYKGKRSDIAQKQRKAAKSGNMNEMENLRKELEQCDFE